jgi:hypothetical protein
MAQFRRSPANTKITNLGAGPYLARVVGHLDPTFTGGLQVTLLRPEGNKLGDENHVYSVKFASPFFGSTAFEFMGKNTASRNVQDNSVSNTQEAYNDTQKSYGMWFVPPDVGVTVLVTFVNGDSSNGFWFACVPPTFSTHMVPAMGGSEFVDMDDADKKKYATKQPLPVAEVNRRINKIENRVDIDNIKKPLHPIAEAFLTQGLLEDDIRGVTTTTSRREVPSSVFGISTPGPLDKRPGAKRASIGKIQDKSTNPVPVSRLGGTTLVMDDGDDRYQRKKSAGELGQGDAYIDILDPNNKEKADPTIPYNEYFRVRTRTGHQILLHNSEDLIYIGNAKGTAWVELTSNGKIDIFSQDSISIHTENDLNIRADRDVNLEAGRNINFRTASGRWHVDVATDLEFKVGNDAKITIDSNFDLKVQSNTKITSGSNFDLRSGGNNKFTAGGNTDIKTGGNHTESASRIDMNSFPAQTADEAVQISPLSLRDNPATSVTAGWAEKKYQSGTVNSIMRRIPMHEPWLLHENFSPDLLTPDKTDREAD